MVRSAAGSQEMEGKADREIPSDVTEGILNWGL